MPNHLIKKMNQNIREIAERIRETTCICDKPLLCLTRRSHFAQKEGILRDLNMTLDELFFMKKSSNGSSNKILFREEFKNNSLNSMMLHGRKSLAKEKRILKDINIQERYVASFKLLEVLKKTVTWNPCLNNWQKLQGEVEQFQLQWEEAAGSSTFVKGKVPNYESLKKDVKDHIKLLCDEYLEERKQWMECAAGSRRAKKQLEALNKVLYSLGEKLKKLYDVEI